MSAQFEEFEIISVVPRQFVPLLVAQLDKGEIVQATPGQIVQFKLHNL